MQIEGFWYYLFSGVIGAGTLHYAIAKIFGPLFFGRGWCGYACWTAMVLDLLPYKRPQGPRKRIGFIRYIVFGFSLLLVVALFLIGEATPSVMFRLFILGNIVYYVVGIALAVAFRDNRAFCKYICPVTVFLKPLTHYSMLRIRFDEDKCIHCGKCREVCPMDVEVNNDSRKRRNAEQRFAQAQERHRVHPLPQLHSRLSCKSLEIIKHLCCIALPDGELKNRRELICVNFFVIRCNKTY